MGQPKIAKPVEELIADYELQILKLKERIIALRELQSKAGLAFSRLNTDGKGRTRMKRGDLKARVLDLLRERGAHGLNATLAADLTAKQGDPMDRGSVSSLLSRLKSDGIVEHDGNLYRLTGSKDAGEADHIH